MSLSYTPHECRSFYRESKHKGKALSILLDMNPYSTIPEMREILGVKSQKSKSIRQKISESKYPALYAKIVDKYGDIKGFCKQSGISYSTMYNLMRGTAKPKTTTLRAILDSVDMTEEEAQKEWNPCMEKDTAKA